jgi:hypothetical protein
MREGVRTARVTDIVTVCRWSGVIVTRPAGWISNPL